MMVVQCQHILPNISDESYSPSGQRNNKNTMLPPHENTLIVQQLHAALFLLMRRQILVICKVKSIYMLYKLQSTYGV